MLPITSEKGVAGKVALLTGITGQVSRKVVIDTTAEKFVENLFVYIFAGSKSGRIFLKLIFLRLS